MTVAKVGKGNARYHPRRPCALAASPASRRHSRVWPTAGAVVAVATEFRCALAVGLRRANAACTHPPWGRWGARVMARKPISVDVQANVLVRSRRRCCICYGLNRDISIKQGQIAHLDQNSANAAEDNLAFLCMPHHDQYDSLTRQSKNLSENEVRTYRDELHRDIVGLLDNGLSVTPATKPWIVQLAKLAFGRRVQ